MEELCCVTEEAAALALLRYVPIPSTRTAARITIIAITRTISTNVKPLRDFITFFIVLPPDVVVYSHAIVITQLVHKCFTFLNKCVFLSFCTTRKRLHLPKRIKTGLICTISAPHKGKILNKNVIRDTFFNSDRLQFVNYFDSITPFLLFDDLNISFIFGWNS